MSIKKIALIGANGMLASMIRQTLPNGLALHQYDLPQFDLTNFEKIRDALISVAPDVIINCAAFTQVDNCETQQELAYAVNGEGPGGLAMIAKELQSTLVHISTDFVFSGQQIQPYVEEDSTEPLSVYGMSKLQGERSIMDSGLIDYYIVRTSWLYGPNGPNFVETMIRLAKEREELGIVADQIGTPTYTGDLAAVIWRLLGLDGANSTPVANGLYHYSNAGECSWYDFTCEIIKQFRTVAGEELRVETVNPITSDQYPMAATRPRYSVLSKAKIKYETGMTVPLWQESLSTYLKERMVG